MSRVRLYLPALAMLLAATACSATSDVTAPLAAAVPVAANSLIIITPTLQPVLQRMTSGLLYTSESDYPFVYFRRAVVNHPPVTPLSGAEFRSLLGIAPDKQVEIITLDEFFARHIERVDPYDSVAVARIPRYTLLRETLRFSLAHTVVYRVGTIAIDCYAVGFNWRGELEGLTTISIET
ncbi:MAG: nuclease A inhibitor family protein [bacterium]